MRSFVALLPILLLAIPSFSNPGRSNAVEARRHHQKHSKVQEVSCPVQSPKKQHKQHKKHKSSTHHKQASFASAKNSTTTKKTSSKPVSSHKNATISSSGGLLQIQEPRCGANGAQLSVTKGAGPNGAESFLNCGLSKSNPNSPWNPPNITIDQLVTVDLDTALKQANTFQPCTPFISMFKKYGAQFNIPPIVLAGIAMEESSCSPSSSGDNGGAFGLMQLVGDNCAGAPNGNCADNDFNIMAGAKQLRQGLDDNNGNFLLALGAYNGWFNGMTYNDAVAAGTSGCCDCQQNLDYLFHFANGWALNKSPYDLNLGTIQNLACCATNSCTGKI